MKKFFFVIGMVSSCTILYSQTVNTSPLPAGETVLGGHLHVGLGNEIWTDAANLYFNYRGNATATHFWNLSGTSGKSIMTLLNNGNVGIGSAGPTTKFDLIGSNYGIKTNYAFARIVNDDAQLDITSSNAGTWGSTINFVEGASGSNTDIWSIARKTSGSGSGLFFNYGSTNSHENVCRVSFLSNGNVGIGTLSPSSKLTISGSEAANGITLERASSYDQLKIWKKDAETYFQHIENETDALNGVGMMIFETNAKEDINSTRGGFSFKNSSGTNYMIIRNNGNVGIGTSNTSAKLSVNGDIKAKEVNVTLDGWADFVFKPNYILRPLSEVEQFIKTNNHLPEIPSEAEVKENGIGLGEMNAKLLQKVEELTLYLIEQNKKIEIVIGENQELKKEIQMLKQKN